jgi:ferredoxin-NADP reductase
MPTTLSRPLADPAEAATPAAGRPPLISARMAPTVDRLLHTRPATVVAIRAETRTIRVLELEPPAGFHHEAGQYLVLRIETPDGPDLRPLSIASPPGASTIELATRLGASSFKRALATLEPGAAVSVSRARGKFRLDTKRPAVIVTGGIGIAPIRSMLRHAIARGYEHPIRLVYANRTPEEIAFRDELADLAATFPSLKITWVVSRTSAGWVAATGMHAGHVDDGVLGPHVAALPDARFYLTGPAPMVADMRVALRHAGVRRRRVRSSEQTLPIDRLAQRKQERS